MRNKHRKNREKTIKDMKLGEQAYVVPWALSFDRFGNGFLNLEAQIIDSPKGTMCMPIKRTSPENADYDINLDFKYFRERYEWKPCERTPNRS